MKRFWLLSLLVALPLRAELPSVESLQQLCNQDRFSQACLAGMLTIRCGEYHSKLHELGQCLDVAKDAAALLDLQSTTRDGGVQAVAFATELRYLMKQPFTARYLEATRNALDEAMRLGNRLSLWNHTLSWTRQDTSKALWLVGVLFQDTSTSTEQLAMLQEESGVPAANLDLLSEVLDLLEPEQLAREDYTRWLTLYPSLGTVPSNSQFNPTLYHFYTLSYLALRTRWRSHNRKLAAFTAFWIDVSYKFRAIDPERWPRDPRPFSATENESRLRDLYAVYLGSHWAAGLEAPSVSFEAFSVEMAANPSGYLRKLYRQGP